MRTAIQIVLLSILVLDTHAAVRFATVYRTGITSDQAGLTGIVVADFGGAAGNEIISCSGGHPFALSRSGDIFIDSWYGPRVGCAGVAIADVSGQRLLVVGGNTKAGTSYYDPVSGGVVYFFSPDRLEPVAQFALPDDEPVSGVRVGEVDGDAEMEIIIVNDSSTFVFDSATFALEWRADERGGPRLELADVDGDGVEEIITGGDPAHVLSAKLRTTLWSYLGGFGRAMAAGDSDGDGEDEIAFIDDYYVSLFDPDTREVVWTGTDIADALGFADLDGDGIEELLMGNNQWGSARVLEAATGTTLASIPNPEHGTSSITAGDLDGDGVPEIIWGAGLSSSGTDAFFVGDWQSESLEWEGLDLDYPLAAAMEDLEGDGDKELLIVSRSTGSGYDGGIVIVRDGKTFAYERAAMEHYHSLDIEHVAVGHLDSDTPQKEILLAGVDWYDGTLQTVDGLSLLPEWNVKTMGNGVSALAIANTDQDSRDEIIAASSDRRVYVLNGASSVIEWLSPVHPDPIRRVVTHDVGNDGVLDLIVTTKSGIYLHQISGTTDALVIPTTEAEVAIGVDADPEGQAALLVVENTSDYSTSSSSLSRFTLTGERTLQCSLTHLIVDLVQVRTAAGTMIASAGSKGEVALFPATISNCSELSEQRQLSSGFRRIKTVDLEDDGIDELLLETLSAVEIVRPILGDPVAGDANGDGAVTVADIF
ncbi:MAG: VCBS repeat-containing protein, partial [Acidobacteria bacterium]|nr:VCBS repeat-containing protein [Acidobacteriota bacterium]